jgi:hypothetical protein
MDTDDVGMDERQNSIKQQIFKKICSLNQKIQQQTSAIIHKINLLTETHEESQENE